MSGIVDVLVANGADVRRAHMQPADFQPFQPVAIIEVELRPQAPNGRRFKALRAVPLPGMPALGPLGAAPADADVGNRPHALIIGVIGTCMTATPGTSHKVRVCLDNAYFASSYATFQFRFHQALL